MRLSRPRLETLVTALAALAGLAALVLAIPPVEDRLAATRPFALARHLSHLASMLAGLFLLFLAGQLHRRRRRAWQLATALLAVATVASLVREGDWRVSFAAVPLALLLLARDRFRAPSDPPTLLRLFAFAPLWTAAVGGIGLGSLWLERAHLEPPFSLRRSVATVTWALVGEPGAYRYGHRHFERFFEDALLLLAATGVLAGAWLACRPIVQRPTHSPADWARARALVAAWGTDTLSYFALRRDKSFFFASDGRALIAYGYFAGYALATGDPIGDPRSLALAIAEFLAMCRERGWGVGFLAVREQMLAVYREQGLHGTYLGDEAIIDCRRFHLEGPEMRSVRQPVNKLRKQGYTVELVDESAAGPETLKRLREISALHHPGEVEHGFTMALGEPVDGLHPELLLAIARNPEGLAEGFLRFVPCFGDDPGLSLDLMRRDPAAPNGITELLIAESALAARERGIRRLSINFAAYGRLLETDLPLSWVERALRAFVLRTDPLFQTRSLWSFNRRFEPEWLPRSLVYEAAATFPRVALCFIIAEGFVRIPGIGPLLVAQPPNRG